MDKEKRNSLLLVVYLLLAFGYYFVETALRAGIFVFITTIAIVTFLSLEQKRVFYLQKLLSKFLIVFFGVLLIQLFNDTITPFIVYLITTPLIAIFVLNNRFNTRLLKIPLFFSSLFFLLFFFRHGTLQAVFGSLSANYVSVVMIMNVVLINLVEIRQKEKISILPSLLCLLFSLLAIGRAGILCSMLLFLNVISARWAGFTSGRKWGVFLLFFLPFIGFVIANIDAIMAYGEGLSMMEKFSKNGIESNSREILINEYLDHMNFENILLGYNFSSNYWFLHYGLNPHNSYIRLHHYYGVFFFVVILFIVKNLFKLVKANRFLAGCVFIILLRAVTDTLLFQYIYDFVLLSVLLIPLNKKIQRAFQFAKN